MRGSVYAKRAHLRLVAYFIAISFVLGCNSNRNHRHEVPALVAARDHFFNGEVTAPFEKSIVVPEPVKSRDDAEKAFRSYLNAKPELGSFKESWTRAKETKYLYYSEPRQTEGATVFGPVLCIKKNGKKVVLLRGG